MRILSLPVAALAALILIGTHAECHGALRPMSDSIKPVPMAGLGPHVVRSVLSSSEMSADLTFTVSLKMRDLAGLEARLAAGETISQDEMEASYLPLRSDYDRVAAWLASQGFTQVLPDRNHTNIIVTGTVAQVSQSLGTAFARVAAPASGGLPAGEFTSAVSPPLLPDAIIGPVLGIDGLQPHIRLHRARELRAEALNPQAVVQGFSVVAPSDLAAAYNVSSKWTGSGQTIAIYDLVGVQASDLTSFWNTAGSTQTAANVTTINLNSGPVSDPTGGFAFESALDVEWAGAMAPGARIRLYLSTSLSQVLTQVANDQSSFPTMQVLSISFGANESDFPLSTIAAYHQQFVQLANQGITVFASAGDGGSNPDDNTGSYNQSAPLAVQYPSTDTAVVAVGGTTLTFNSSGKVTAETTWNQISRLGAATGGGISSAFLPSSWEVGTPNSTRRCVPDVAAAAGGPSTASEAFVVFQGSAVAGYGTSWASPVWAAFCAQINQARGSSVGLLGPKIYPLAGSASFNDITTGNNGAYSAGVGYDLCTGIGTPNVANLIFALTGPSITTQPAPASQTVKAGSAITFSVVAAGSGLTYQWNLNGVAIAGATGASLTLSNIGTDQAGLYTITVSNSAGSTTSSTASVTVTSDAKLSNLSARAFVGTGGNVLIAGFITANVDLNSVPKNILMTGFGPFLSTLNVPGALVVPQLTMYDGSGSPVATDSSWSTAPTRVTGAGASTLNIPLSAPSAQLLATYGGTPPSGSTDCALVATAPAGAVTSIIAGANNSTGVAQTAVFDVDSAFGNGGNTARLTNLSGRAFVGTGGNVLIAGFVISAGASGAPETVLIEAQGPALSSQLSGALVQPTITIYDGSGHPIASNTGWSNGPSAATGSGASSLVGSVGIDPATAAIQTRMTGTSLPAGSADCALVATLPAGGYTVIVSGVGNTTGIALAGIWEIK